METKKIGTFNNGNQNAVFLGYETTAFAFNPTTASWMPLDQILLSEGMGALGSFNNVFVKDYGGDLFRLKDSLYAEWENLGSPPGNVSVGESMGAYAIYGSLPYVFMKASDDNLWVTWHPDSWHWQERGKPSSSVGIKESMGAIQMARNNVGTHNVFVKGTDDNLWLASWHTTSDLTWECIGTPPNKDIDKSIGAINANGVGYVFISTTDGHLWAISLTDEIGTWQNLGIPYAAAGLDPSVYVHQGMGVLCPEGKQISVYVQGTYGSIYSCSFNESNGWTWQHLITQPSPSVITGSAGINLVDNIPQVWATSDDEIPNLWLASCPQGEWEWSNQGSPYNRP